MQARSDTNSPQPSWLDLPVPVHSNNSLWRRTYANKGALFVEKDDAGEEQLFLVSFKKSALYLLLRTGYGIGQKDDR